MPFRLLPRFPIVFVTTLTEEKPVKEIRNIETTFLVCGESAEVTPRRLTTVMNLPEISPAVTTSFIRSVLSEGIFTIYVTGQKTQFRTFRKETSQLN